MTKEQMTLGGLIASLSDRDSNAPVYFDFVHFRPQGIHAYRGFYDQLAIGYGCDDITVGQLLELCRNGKGYKGEDTLLWVANNNESGDAIVDVVDRDWRVVLATEMV